MNELSTSLSYKFKRVLPALVIAFSLTGTVSKAQEQITLQQAVEYTLKNNLQIKQAALGESLSNETLKQSKLALYPNLNASSSLNFNFGRSVDPTSYQFVTREVTNSNGSISSNVTLFQGFQKLNQIAQNKYQLEADKSYTKKVTNDLLLLVVTTYLQVLNNRDLLAASKQQLGISTQQLDRVQKLFDVGNNTLADLSQAKAQVATSELNQTNAQNQLDISYLSLAQLMERDPASKFDVVLPAVSDIGKINTNINPSDVYNKSKDIFPDIRLAEFNLEVSRKALDIAKGSLYPRLSLGASIGTGYSNNRTGSTAPVLNGTRQIGVTQVTNEPVVTPAYTSTSYNIPFKDQIDQNLNQSVGFSLSIPLFNGLQAKSSVRRAKISLQNAEIAEQIQKNNLNKTINQAVLDLRAAEKSYYSAQSAFNSSQDAFNVTQQRYTVGLVNALDFNQAQTNLNTAQFNLIQAKYNLIFRNKVIDYYLGNPLTF